jgi:hypothetical protein
VRCVAVARYRVVVCPLIRVIEVSEWVQRTVQAVVVVAIATAVGRVGIVGGIVVLGIVIGGVGLRVQGTGVIYRRLVGAHSISYTHTNADTSEPAVAINATYDTGGCGAIRGLAGIGEETALAVAGIVDVLVAGLRVCLHYNDCRPVFGKDVVMSEEGCKFGG